MRKSTIAKIIAWTFLIIIGGAFLIIIGGAFIVWADAICDFFKWNFSTNTMRVFIITSIILVVALVFAGKKVIKLMKGQLGD